MIVGVVLTGGASVRMGRTKALVEVAGVAMAERVATALDESGCDRVVLFGGDPEQLSVLGRPVMSDRNPGTGPLGGILDALAQLSGPETDIIVVACDLAHLGSDDVRRLIDAAAENPTADVVVANGGQIEPACALWRCTALEGVRTRFDAGERAIHRAFAVLRTVEVAMPATSLRNINTPDDLDRYP